MHKPVNTMGRRYDMMVVEQGGAAKRLLGPTGRGDVSVDDAGRPRVLVRPGVEPADNFPPTVGLAANCKYGCVLELCPRANHNPKNKVGYSPALQVSLAITL